MRKLLLLLILLSGCKAVTMDEMRRAEAACKAHGGLSHVIKAAFFEPSFDRIVCHDGTVISRLPERGKK